MSLIVDASVAVKLVAAEYGSAEAREFATTSQALTSLDFMLVEVANVLWKKVRAGTIPAVQLTAGLGALRRVFPVLTPASDVLDDAAEFAVELVHPIYDCLYLALAAREKAPLVTADRRLLALAPKLSGRVALRGLDVRLPFG